MTLGNRTETKSAPAVLTPFDSRHLPGALKLSQEMRWPYRLEDWAFAAEVGAGFALERAGEVIGTAMYWAYGADFASVGMIIVTGAEQGAGHGARLFDALLDRTHGRNVLLNSTEEGLALYRRNGFSAYGTVCQHQGQLAMVAVPDMPSDIRRACAADLAAIQAFDHRAMGLPRGPMIAALAEVGSVYVIERGGEVAGYAIARRFGRGHVIGPVAAESDADARRLTLAQLAALQGQFVRIDVQEAHGLGAFLEGFGLACVGKVTSMVKGQRPVSVGAARIYALANQSFG